MLKAIDVALYFLNKDPDLFNKELIERNGHIMYEGNARLNKYLHIAQNVHIAKFGTPLFSDSLYAYDNGGVVPQVFKLYPVLKERPDNGAPIPGDEQHFLDQIFNILRGASVDELIDISHQDAEWDDKNRSASQRMDSLSRVDEYREQYSDILTVMEMGLC